MKQGRTVVFVTNDKDCDKENIDYIKNKGKLLQVIDDDSEIVSGAEYIICTGRLSAVKRYLEQGNMINTLIIKAGFVGSNILKSSVLPQDLNSKSEIVDCVLSENIEATEYIMNTNVNSIENIYMLSRNIEDDLTGCEVAKESLSLFDSSVNNKFKYFSVRLMHNPVKELWGSQLNLMFKSGRFRNVNIAIGKR